MNATVDNNYQSIDKSIFSFGYLLLIPTYVFDFDINNTGSWDLVSLGSLDAEHTMFTR